MKTVRSAIVMSDLHLGRDLSYLYSKDNKSAFKKNKQALQELLKQVGRPDELILNGDFLELSLAGHDIIYDNVKDFFLIIAEIWVPKRIVFIPGNHDHHYWRQLIEQIFISDRINRGEKLPSQNNFIYSFVDQRFSSNDPLIADRILLPALWPPDLKMPEFVIKYPHHLIRSDLNSGEKKYYLITHGHFLERLFTPINIIVEPAHIEELEAFNNIWLEAFNYDIGQSGRLTKKAVKFMRSYEEGLKDDKKELKNILTGIFYKTMNKLKLPKLKSWLIKLIYHWIVNKLLFKKESHLFKAAINIRLKYRIIKYIKKYVLNRYRKEKAKEHHLPVKKDIPVPFCFVFGHTHNPIVEASEMKQAILKIDKNNFPIYNSGGWLRTDGKKRNGENAGILVIDQNGIRWESLAGKLV
jgi:UDP-2,3-diacylglucosamine pyrophosphatase LpxH